jgi:hypothetical protein
MAANAVQAPPSVRTVPCASLRIGQKEGYGTAIMGDIVNLNKFRKVRQRADRKQLVAVNRQKFARPKADLVKLEAERLRAAQVQDGHALDGHALDDLAPEEGARDERPGAPRETD